MVHGATAGTNALLERKGAQITSAMGCVIADMRRDFVQTVNQMADEMDEAELGALMQRHFDECQRVLDAARTRFERRDAEFVLDMAYVGQTHTVSVPIAAKVEGGAVVPPTRAAITEAFDAAYRAAYGRLLPVGTRRVMNLKSAIIGRRPKFDLAALAPTATGEPEAARKGARQVHFMDGWRETAICGRLALPAGAYLSAQLTLVPRPGGAPLIALHLKALHPFLGTGDFGRVNSAIRWWMTSRPPTTRSRRSPIPPSIRPGSNTC